MPLRYTTLDVFTDRPFGGNPLAVFCDQAELDGRDSAHSIGSSNKPSIAAPAQRH
jgi:predicted PhzF superfamily epimerase YddE/YHI9